MIKWNVCFLSLQTQYDSNMLIVRTFSTIFIKKFIYFHMVFSKINWQIDNIWAIYDTALDIEDAKNGSAVTLLLTIKYQLSSLSIPQDSITGASHCPLQQPVLGLFNNRFYHSAPWNNHGTWLCQRITNKER